MPNSKLLKKINQSDILKIVLKKGNTHQKGNKLRLHTKN